MEKLSVRYPKLPKGCSIASFAMRETDGKDEEKAAQLAKAKGGSASAPEELVALSITEVDGVKVSQPFDGFFAWNTKTRTFALHAWRKLNAIDESELEGFLTAGEIVTDSPK